MKIYLFIFILLFITSCTKSDSYKNQNSINLLSDSVFIETINVKTLTLEKHKIDSVFSLENISEHQRGILFLKRGENFFNSASYIESIASLTKALGIFKKENHKKFIVKTYLQLSFSNSAIGNIDTALIVVNKALEIIEKEGFNNERAKAINILAHIYYQKEMFSYSIQYLIEYSNLQLELKKMDKLASTYSNIGLIFEKMNKVDSAIHYYKKSRKLYLGLKENFLSTSIRNLAGVYYDKEDYNKSKLYFNEALVIEEKANNLSGQKEIYEGLIQISLRTKNIQSAEIFIAKKDSIEDIISKNKQLEKIKLIEDKYHLINKKQELEQVKKINQKNIIIFSIIIFTLLLLSLLTYLKSKNIKLKLIHDKIKLEQTVLRSQMNPHFIFNILTAIQNSLLDNNPLQTASFISKFAKLIRQNFEFISKENIFLSEEIDSLKNYIETQKMRYLDKFDYEFIIDNNLDLSTIKMPPLLLQPFLENAIEHGFKNIKHKGKLKIYITKEGQFISFKIEDNGKGFDINKPQNDTLHSFAVFKKRLNLMGNKSEKSLKIKSSDKGTVFQFSLRINVY